MKAQTRKAAERLSPNQCCRLSPTGRRCRAARSSPASCLCPRHRTMEQNARSADLSPDLAARLGDIRESLQSVEGICDSLAELYVLLAQNRVSARRAAVLAQISNLVLRLLPDEEADQAPQKPEIKFFFDRTPRRDIDPAEPITDALQLTKHCPGAFCSVRTDYGPHPKKDVTNSEEAAIANFKAIST